MINGLNNIVFMTLGLAFSGMGNYLNAQKNNHDQNKPNIVFILADDLGYAVSLEQNPSHRIPRKKVILGEYKYSTDPQSDGLSVRNVDYYLDGEKIKNMKLPLYFITRSTEIFWISDLPEAKHTLEMKWLNPEEGADIILESAISFGNQQEKIGKRESE